MPPNVATGAVRSYRTVSPLPAPLLALGRFAFCCTFRRLTPPRRYLAPCPLEPGLSSTFREKCSDRPADSGAHHSGMAPASQVVSSASARALNRPLSGQFERARIRVVAFRPGEARGHGGGLAGREVGQQRLQCRVESHARAFGRGRRAAPSTTTVISPRVKLASARAAITRSASVPRYTVSKTFVSSRATAARRVAPNAAARSSSDSAMRCGASKKTSVRVSVASSARRARRSASRAGRNPSNENLSVGGPAMLSAAVIAEGPGRRPRDAFLRHAAHELEPGSESSGVPASLTSAIRAPARNFISSSSMRSARCVHAATRAAAQGRALSAIARPARVFRRNQLRGSGFLARTTSCSATMMRT